MKHPPIWVYIENDDEDGSVGVQLHATEHGAELAFIGRCQDLWDDSDPAQRGNWKRPATFEEADEFASNVLSLWSLYLSIERQMVQA